MNQVIYKYPVELGTFALTLPRGARILSVQTQQGWAKLWALVSTDAKEETRQFASYPTGYPIEVESSRELVYIGTFQLEGGHLIYHLFEQVEKGREKRR